MMEPNKIYFAPMHTAEHILNQTMIRMFQCNRSFSNHIERKKSKCDYYFHRPLNAIEIQLIEQKVNEIINSHLSVTEQLLTFAEAEKICDLEKIESNQPDTVRIIKIGTYDICACIGAHVSNTAEIGAFNITTTSFEDGVLRIRYKLN